MPPNHGFACLCVCVQQGGPEMRGKISAPFCFLTYVNAHGTLLQKNAAIAD